MIKSKWLDVSIHSPRMRGGETSCPYTSRQTDVSIHSPRMRGDLSYGEMIVHSYFYTLPSYEGGDYILQAEILINRFLYTPLI